eukprot:8534485-Alexandrium_andersonii.AAC.1
MQRGVRQGASTSPAVWAITLDYVLSGLFQSWRSQHKGYPLRSLDGSVQATIPGFIFADDIILL